MSRKKKQKNKINSGQGPQGIVEKEKKRKKNEPHLGIRAIKRIKIKKKIKGMIKELSPRLARRRRR